ncbi:translocation/assembly module TamB domain-containing protein [Sedimentitalea arenosa]|uniref:Translocation/assembly module TamB domain-containing protein n=1 Tax=Sedimentitalea arenosa TaxID=2798803 RepID=A0A8J7J148_9RHOB|nr:translocation/assembly module TamB domain-containing protein [Arenibacterium arenosum]MBJ6371320.1 translocation/assembly module TamB domain-containing protein [Arenibacterium arenosum]
MRLLAYLLVAALFAAIAPAAPVSAQDEEEAGGFLVNLLQDNLSGDNRYIRVVGLEGALSGAARIQQITVSDDDGVWLTVNEAVLDWNRLALVRGRFSVNTLSAAEIIVARKPGATEAAEDLPEPEAKPFQLPELPVAVEIGELRVDRIELGEPLIGRAAELAVDGSLSLADGTLSSGLEITRLDKPTDQLDLTAGFANETSVITLDLRLIEAAGGLVSEVLSIPDRPSILLTAQGEGPVTDFTADITLASNDEERLAGQVRLSSVTDPDADDASPPGIGFEADLAGDITPLLAEDYREFFGDGTRLQVQGRSESDGRIAVETFDVRSNAMDLTGGLDISGAGVVERVQLQGRIEPPSGADVVLPIGEPRTTIRSASIDAQLDTSQDNGWTLRLGVDGLGRPDLALARAEITASGTLDQQNSMRLIGQVNAALRGIDLQDPALKQAVGSQVLLDGSFDLQDETALSLQAFRLRGPNYQATVDARIDGLDSGFAVDGTATVRADDLARFSALAGRDLTGAVEASVTGQGSPLAGSFDIDLTATAQDPSIGMEQVDNLIAGTTRLRLDAKRDETGLEIRTFDLAGTALSADAEGTVRSGDLNATFNARLDDLARVVPDVSGPVTLSGDVTQTEAGLTAKVRANGPERSMARLDGSMTPEGDIDVDYDATLAAVERFVPQIVGAIRAEGRASRKGETWQVTSRINGPTGSIAKLDGAMEADGSIEVTYDATVAAVERFVPQIVGAVTARGVATRVDEAWQVTSSVNGPTGSVAQLDGSMDADGTIQVTYDATVAAVERFVPQIVGAVKARGVASRVDQAWEVTSSVNGPTGSTAELQGTMDAQGAIDVTYDASLTRIERFVPEFPGTLTAKGTASRRDTLWTIDTSATGPASVTADVSGTFDQATMEADMTATGQLQVGAANQFIKPNSIRGLARFDLALNGPASPESLSGTITMDNAAVAIPDIRQAVDDLDVRIGLANGSADVSATAQIAAGGQIRVSGPIALAPPFDASIVVDLQRLILTDNVSIDSSADGRITFNGALAGPGAIAGEILIGETNINIATMAGSASAAPIPPMQHVGESAAERATREWAGLIDTSTGETKSGGPVYSLDVRIVTAESIFVRGRGLQAELDGDILVRGTTAQVIPSGQIDLVRGTMAILTRRLNLTRGLVALQGSLVPYMEFVATTSTSQGDATIEIAGPLNAPKVNVYSDPERPSEEALAMLVFGDQFTNLSPLKVAQLAASLAQLSGGGGGVGESAREGLGVDAFDIGTDDTGSAQVGVGKYIADGVYTDVNINTEGNTEVNLNLDLTDNFTVKGSVDNTGETSLGLFFERDY